MSNAANATVVWTGDRAVAQSGFLGLLAPAQGIHHVFEGDRFLLGRRQLASKLAGLVGRGSRLGRGDDVLAGQFLVAFRFVIPVLDRSCQGMHRGFIGGQLGLGLSDLGFDRGDVLTDFAVVESQENVALLHPASFIDPHPVDHGGQTRGQVRFSNRLHHAQVVEGPLERPFSHLGHMDREWTQAVDRGFRQFRFLVRHRLARTGDKRRNDHGQNHDTNQGARHYADDAFHGYTLQ